MKETVICECRHDHKVVITNVTLEEVIYCPVCGISYEQKDRKPEGLINQLVYERVWDCEQRLHQDILRLSKRIIRLEEKLVKEERE